MKPLSQGDERKIGASDGKMRMPPATGSETAPDVFFSNRLTDCPSCLPRPPRPDGFFSARHQASPQSSQPLDSRHPILLAAAPMIEDACALWHNTRRGSLFFRISGGDHKPSASNRRSMLGFEDRWRALVLAEVFSGYG